MHEPRTLFDHLVRIEIECAFCYSYTIFDHTDMPTPDVRERDQRYGIPSVPAPIDQSAFPTVTPDQESELNEPPMMLSGDPWAGPKRRKPWRLIVLVSLVILLIGGTAYALMTDLKYRIPGLSSLFNAKESELVGLMYDRLANVSGADFSLAFSLAVGERDADAVAPTPPANATDENQSILQGTTFFGTERRSDLGSIETDGLIDFLSGDTFNKSFLDMEQQLPSNLQTSLQFRGSAPALAEGTEEETLPDVSVGLEGEGKFESLTIALNVEARVVDEYVYYKISDFPMFDLSQGHPNEWIRLSPENDQIAGWLPNYNEWQTKTVEMLRSLIAETRDTGLLSFRRTGTAVDIEGINAVPFSVDIDPDKIPAWLDRLAQVAKNDEASPIKFDTLTDDEKTQIVEAAKRGLENFEIHVALHPGTGDLMQLVLQSRIVPPESSTKFQDEQFNSTVTLTMWNHGSPAKVTAPSPFIDQDELVREQLGVSEEVYADLRQANRVASIRTALMRYHLEHHAFPASLEEVTKTITDVNTGDPYTYTVSGNDYALTYTMNGTREVLEPSGSSSLFGGSYDLSDGFGYHTITGDENDWHEGENVADRYSPIADTWKASAEHVTASGKNDHDALVALAQAQIVDATKDQISAYAYQHDMTYPASLDLLPKTVSSLSTYSVNSTAGYVCENLVKNTTCTYALDDGEEPSFTVTYGLAGNDIDAEWRGRLYSAGTSFTAGDNVIEIKSTTPLLMNDDGDTDGDGLSDTVESSLGTSSVLTDTDGDGYDDKTEYDGGYNPLGTGLATTGTWSGCISLDEHTTCTAYCESVGKTCSDRGVTSREYEGWGAEAWSTPAACGAGETAGGQKRCTEQTNAGGARWKCFCQ